MIASHDISRDSERTTADEAPDASIPTANASERTSCPSGAAVEGQSGDSPCPTAPSDISPRQRWAHLIVLNIINANLPLDRLADYLKIPFLTLMDYINTPEVRAEIDAYDQLLTIRARLLGQTARPISLRRLLDVLESPAPGPVGRDPESDQRALHRHAELIRRTATTIARESRAFAPKPAPNQRAQKGAPSASSGSSIPNDSNSRAACPGNTENPAHSGVPSPCQPTVAEDARGCASPEPVDARRPQPTGSTDPANAAAHTAHPATTPSDPSPSAPVPLGPSAPSASGSSPSDSSPPSSPRPSAFNPSSRPSRSSRSDASPPLRDSDSSAPSAFSSRSRHARDRPAA